MPRPRKKRQTRLTFSPLPSSSPAASSYPNQVQERAASVRYDKDGRPAKKRRLDGTSSSQPSAFSSSPVIHTNPRVVVKSPSKGASISKQPSIFSGAALPTPAPSSQVEDMGKLVPVHNRLYTIISSSSDDEENTLHSSGVHRTLFSRRTMATRDSDRVSDTLSDDTSSANDNATNSCASSLSKAPDSSAKDPRARNNTFRSHTGNWTKAQATIQLGTDLGDDERVVILSSEDESDMVVKRARFLLAPSRAGASETPPQSQPGLTRRSQPGRVASGRSSKPSIKPSLPTRTQSKGSPVKTPTSVSTSTMPEGFKNLGDQLDLTMTNKTPLKANRHQIKVAGMTSPHPRDHANTDSDEIVTPARRKRPASTSKPDMSDSESDDVRAPTSNRKRAILKKPNILPNSEKSDASDEDEVISSVRKGRLQRACETSKALASHTDDESLQDIKGDLEDLKDTVVRNTRTRGSQRTPKKTKAQESLELLRRKRAGEKVDEGKQSPSQDKTPSSSKRALYDSTSEDDESSSEASENNEIYDLPIRRRENLDTYEEDFIASDGDDTIGAPPGQTDMPFEFTRHAHRKPFEHFKDVVEWMVHNRLNPAFPRDDPSYRVAFHKLDDEAQGLTGSKFMSAAWGGEFFKAIKERPDMGYIEVGTGLPTEHCAACNRSNHPATFQVVFSGRRYNRQTLEDISDDEDDGGEPDEQRFYVGRTCCANAETAHALNHWRHSLNHYVLDSLRKKGHTSDEKIVQRERWSTKRKSDYANQVVDEMEASGETRTLYKEFKENQQAARNERNDRYSYGKKRTR